ncbi:MAG TPA: hypothetical protein VIG72_03825 [Pontibacter sp.]
MKFIIKIFAFVALLLIGRITKESKALPAITPEGQTIVTTRQTQLPVHNTGGPQAPVQDGSTEVHNTASVN